MRDGFVATLAMLAVALAPGPALACDDGEGRPAVAVRPLHPTLVELETLEVRVTVLVDRSEVEAVFTLRNTGPATTVLVGFAEDDGEPCPGMCDFRAFVDGSEVTVERDPDLVPESPLGTAAAWHTWEVDFAAGQTRQLRYTCWSHNGWSQEGRWTGYVLTPAAAWHGNVGTARVVFELEEYLPYDIAYPTPLGYGFEGDNLVWEWRDFEPLWDLAATFDGGLSLLRSVRDVPGNSVVFYLAKEWAELSRAGSYEELLAQVEVHRHDEGLRLNPHLAPVYTARALLGLGRTDDAVRNWRQLLVLALPGDDFWRVHAAQDEAFYHLARYYHAAGDQARVEELYRELKRRPTFRGLRSPLVLLTWIESLLPPELTPGQPPVVRAVLRAGPEPPVHITLERGEVRRLHFLEIHAEDPDADLVRLEWAVWYLEDDPERPAAKGDALVAPSPEVHSAGEVWLRPGVPLRYRVEAVDLRGNRGSTGVLEYVPPVELPGRVEEPGDEAPGLLPPRPAAWLLLTGGVLAVALGALLLALRRRRAPAGGRS